MEEDSPPPILEGKITGISFSLATRQEICLASISDCPISHASQLSNPFLGLPLEIGKCESCGAAEVGKCEGHFGYIELPIPIYHPSHIDELKNILRKICLKCLKFKNNRLQSKNAGVLDRAFSVCCDEAAQVTVVVNQKKDGACILELKLPKNRVNNDNWDFLNQFGYRYGRGANIRPLLPSEVLKMMKKMPEATKKKLAAKGCFFQEGYIMQHLAVPPNCLSTPDVSDGITVSSSDISMPMLRKVLRQVEIIKSSRSGAPNFESLEVEVNDLQLAVTQYLQSRGAKATPDRNTRYSVARTATDSSSTKAWLEKMKTLFISKGSGFSSRSVITGDPYKGVGEIGIPYEIAQRITFEERVTEHNMKFLQKLVDDNLCLTYRDGQSTFSLREGSKGHTFLKPGQVVHRKIMEGDVIFINRPPTTHKHSLQALSVYIHDDHTFKINPLICGPLSADFDGDCIHIFYPQSPEAKAEVLELFAVEKQLLSSHTGNVNLQLGSDSVLSLKTLFKKYFFTKAQVQQLSHFTSNQLPNPSMLKVRDCGLLWTVLELLETSLPRGFDCVSEKFVIRDSKILKLDYSRDAMQSIMSEIISSIFFNKGAKEVIKLFDSLQPMLMENLCVEGFNLSLEDFIVPEDVIKGIEGELQDLSPLLKHLRSNYNEVIDMQLAEHLRASKNPISDFILRFSSMGNLIDPKSDSAVTRIVQQVGFLGLQIYERGRLYSKTMTEDLSAHFVRNYPFPTKYPYEEFGLVRGCLFNGLDPYQEMVHSVASREVMVRSSRGLTEPGILFKNSMAILRDVVICYDGTVRNVCSNSVIQFEYGGGLTNNLFAAGEPVGVLAATAMSNPAYKAVLDSSPSSNSSWNMMKEILQCGVKFNKNVQKNRHVVLYLNECCCGKKHCREEAAYEVKNLLRKVTLNDVAVEFLIEYKRQKVIIDNADLDEAGLVGHVHLNKTLLKESNISMENVLSKCEDALNTFRKKKKGGNLFKQIDISCCECSFQQSSTWTPCLQFFWRDIPDIHLEKTSRIFADVVCPVLLSSIIHGDPRVKEANITWVSPKTTVWVKKSSDDHQDGDLVIDVILEEESVKNSGDAWRTVMDACLPVIHVIDTTRSIPYAIKEVENLLGIACAFEQAVQRLSTSVSMVTKGMLKEHLLLLASSMTCAGFLIGFNLSGIKALNRTLNFQVPFSEATVYTPKRCFEKAAEKCHADSLSSIVGSCSWGKPVAVGTGSRFDILWDTREVELNQKDGIDVYSFLHMVGGGSEEADSGCLGGEVDSFDMDNYMETGSPEIESGLSKPMFEDGLELDLDVMDVGQSTWGSDPAPDNGTSNGGWGAAVKSTPATGGGWGATQSQDAEPSSGAWGATKSQDAEPSSGGWAATKSQDAEPSSGGWGAPKSLDAEPSSGAWAATKSQDAEPSSGGWGAPKSKDVEPSGTGWGASKTGKETEQASSGAWGQEKATKQDEPAAWGTKKNGSETAGGSGASTWGQEKVVAKEDGPGWGGNKTTEKGSGSSWGPKAVTADEPAWGGKKSGSDANKGSGSAPWGQRAAKPPVDQSESPKDSSTGGGQWGKKDTWNAAAAGGSSSSAWGKSVEKPQEATWNSGVEASAGESVNDGQWGAAENKTEGSDWTTKVEEKTDPKVGWGQKKDQTSEADGSSEKGQEEGEQKAGSWSWNRKAEQKPDQGGGWKKKENWGPKRDRPIRPPGGPNDGPRPDRGPLTASRQRLDLFTPEEQEILTDIEPIMHSVRRIMSQQGYTDGEPLPTEDQTYIRENVFAHHPEKAQKAGAGIDFFTITKHTEFQDSRCFFVVSTDGRKEDFSYRKCLENYVRGKYPEKVDEFIPKYFRKNQPRPPFNREEAGTPRFNSTWKRDSGQADGTEKPVSGWKKDAAEAPVDGTPPATTGWNQGWKKAPEEGVAPAASGWNQGEKKEATVPEGGAPAATGWDQAGDGGTSSSTPKASGWGS